VFDGVLRSKQTRCAVDHNGGTCVFELVKSPVRACPLALLYSILALNSTAALGTAPRNRSERVFQSGISINDFSEFPRHFLSPDDTAGAKRISRHLCGQTVPGRSAKLFSIIRLRTFPKIFTKSLNEVIRLTIALPRQTLVFPRFKLGFMTSKYVIFKLRSDGSFMWIEAVEYILATKQRLEMFAAKEPGDYHLWDSSTHKFVNPFTKSASF
jgi:hypothetical protein